MRGSDNLNPGALSSPAKQLWLDGLKRLVEQLCAKLSPPNTKGCREWTAARDWNGYGSTYAFRRQWKAHRLFYFLWYGEIPMGHSVLHRCDNPPCCNPEHLFTGTAKDNMDDCVSKGRALGPRGEMNGQHKLIASEVLEIRRRYKPFSRNGNNMYSLAKEFGVHATTIHDIIHWKKWRSLK